MSAPKCDRRRELASEERRKREALPEDVEILERSIRTRCILIGQTLNSSSHSGV